MDGAVGQRRGERLVDEAVLVEERQAVEAAARHAHEEVVAGAGAVDHVEVRRLREGVLEQAAQPLHRHAWNVAAASESIGVSGWRIVLVSTVQPAVEGFAAFARAMGHEPVAVVTSQGPAGRRDVKPDRRAFFDRLVWESPPELDIAIASGRSRVAPLLRAFEPDLVLCLGFPWRLTPEALAVPRLGCVNSHPSRLPRYRGPSPIAWHVRNGEPELGVTFHRMDEQFDTGGVLAQGADAARRRRLDGRPAAALRRADARAADARLRASGRRRPGRRAGRRGGELRRASSRTSTASSTGRGPRTSCTAACARGASSSAGAAAHAPSWTARRGGCCGRASSEARRAGARATSSSATASRCSSAAARTPSGCSNRSPPLAPRRRRRARQRRVVDRVRVVPADLRLARDADLLDAGAEPLVHERVELRGRLPHVDDVDAAVREVRDVEDRAVGVVVLPTHEPAELRRTAPR